uniref:Peptidase S8/S53 domain-containing protein n=1 Tax=Paramoeba aestuarina TaxID=180227 RepID=A0A7S4KV44_9EUKA|mmetsp:Transcript_26026/g.40604  ORF Transcript_26026/g.40604 Transcript_26026/m.40604 type:complete len:293 (+) Transcript_26026:1043-1921(+)
MVVTIPDYNEAVYFNIWINSSEDFSLKITSPDNRSYVLKRSDHAEDPLTPIAFPIKRFANAKIGLTVNSYSQGRPNEQDVWLELKHISEDAEIPEGEWTITISSEPGKAIHAWIPLYELRDSRPRGNDFRPHFATFRDDHYTIGSPGTAENAITVAASTSRTSWESDHRLGRINLEMIGSSSKGVCKVAPFSSRGPLRLKQHHKPDICAPGQMIISAKSSQAYHENHWVLREDQNYRAMMGTSMACPVVAGMAAVLLSKERDLTGKEIVSRLTNDSPNWNNEIGYGHAHFPQ